MVTLMMVVVAMMMVVVIMMVVAFIVVEVIVCNGFFLVEDLLIFFSKKKPYAPVNDNIKSNTTIYSNHKRVYTLALIKNVFVALDPLNNSNLAIGPKKVEDP